MDVIDAELRDVRARLSRLYDALETGKLDLDDLAPRIKELKTRQDELNKSKIQVEADFTERKALLRSFIKRIEVNKKQVTVHYNLPIPQDEKSKEQMRILPIVTFGGAEGIRTPDLLRAKEALSQLSYSPKTS